MNRMIDFTLAELELLIEATMDLQSQTGGAKRITLGDLIVKMKRERDRPRTPWESNGDWGAYPGEDDGEPESEHDPDELTEADYEVMRRNYQRRAL